MLISGQLLQFKVVRKHLFYFPMCTGRTDFDVTTGRLQDQGYFVEVYCNTTDQRFTLIRRLGYSNNQLNC